MTKLEKIITILPIIYLVSICVYMLAHRMWFSPDQFFLFALVGTFFIGRSRLFILDWGPFLSLFFGYEFLHGLVPLVTNRVNIWPMIMADKWFFGFIPASQLQTWFYTPANLHWYDYLFVILYISHFVTPMLIGFIFWLFNRAAFKEYALGLIVLSYMSFLTYIAYPAMPPWMASQKGYIPPIQEVTSIVMSHFLPTKISVPTLYEVVRANPVAAVPSLHAAMPFLIWLFLLKTFRRSGWLFLPYVLGVAFAVLYLGEHYFFDVLLGWGYATLAFSFVVNKKFWFGWSEKYVATIQQKTKTALLRFAHVWIFSIDNG
jgi:hypothetical protein